MPNRFSNRGTIDLTKADMFQQIKQRRSLDAVSLYSTAKFKKISDLELEDLEYQSYIWARGDRFYKLAADFYENPDFWWVIALFNGTPTEQHVGLGEEIFIPLEPEIIISLLEVY